MLTLSLALLILSFSTPDQPASVEPDAPSDTVRARWVSASGDGLTHVAGYRVIEYRDAGEGGLEWTLSSTGRHSGNGPSQLWLFSTPSQASALLTTPSDAVAFMMAGDHNDGFATFLIDGVVIGTYDMHGRGERTLLVEGLPRAPHVLTVRAAGRKAPASRSTHVALYGGAALDVGAIATWPASATDATTHTRGASAP